MLVELRVLQARLEFKITESSTGDPALDGTGCQFSEGLARQTFRVHSGRLSEIFMLSILEI